MSDKKEKVFVEGMRYDKPRQGAPDFVKGRFGVKVADHMKFLLKNTEGIDVRNQAVLDFVKYIDETIADKWINYDFLKSQKGPLYLALNTWKPTKKNTEMTDDEAAAELDKLAGGVEYPEDDIKPEDIPF